MAVPIPDKASRGVEAYLFVKSKRAGALKGEATTPAHANEIVLDGFHFGLRASSAVGSGTSTARRQYDALRVIKRIDSTTTGLMSVLATNDQIVEARVSLRKSGDGQADYFTIKLANARVVSSDIDCDDTGHAVEQIEIAFTKVDIEYRKQHSTGTSGAGFSFSDEILPT